MSVITRCPRCGGNIVKPAFDGDGDYPVPPMCNCNDRPLRAARASVSPGRTDPKPEKGDDR